MNEKKWDAFISHASEDKDDIVRPLSTILQNWGVKIWFDETTLVVGDSLSKQIDKGLNDATFGILILSKAFLNKRWPDYEYRSLLSKEENFKKLILPIWHDITLQEVKQFSLYLADIYALNTANNSLLSLAFQLTEVIKPEIYSKFHRLIIHQKMMHNGDVPEFELDKIRSGPKKRDFLSTKLINRIKILRYGISQHFPLSLEDDVDCYLRDSNPESEIEIWETLNASYYEFIEQENIKSDTVKESIASQLLSFSTYPAKNDYGLTNDHYNKLFEVWKKNCYLL